MPTYEYACSGCGIHLDVVQKMTESSLDTCAACGGKLRKVFHPAGILFKGSGFYATDNRSKPKTGTSGGSEKPDGKAAEKTDAADKSGKAADKTAAEPGASSSSPKTGNGFDGGKSGSKPAKETA